MENIRTGGRQVSIVNYNLIVHVCTIVAVDAFPACTVNGWPVLCCAQDMCQGCVQQEAQRTLLPDDEQAGTSASAAIGHVSVCARATFSATH